MIDSGNTAWILTSTALVLLMTLPGLALFYAGLVQAKNVLSVLMHCVTIAALATVFWVVCGYSLAFEAGNAFIGGLGRVLLAGMARDSVFPGTALPESVFVMFQMTFAIITPALIVGAFVERIRFGAVMAFSLIWLLVVYVPVTHWVWGGGWLAELRVMDYAGGIVVHVTAGVSALVIAVMLGAREGFPAGVRPPHAPWMVMVGASLLWVCWFGFNAGSALGAGADAGMAMLATQLSAAVASLTWLVIETVKFGKPSVVGFVTGTIAGLATVTPASGFVGPLGGILLGLSGGILCFLAVDLIKHRWRIDDSLDVLAVHGVGGATGTLLVAFLAVLPGGTGVNAEGGMASQFLVQLAGVAAVAAWSALATFLVVKAIAMTIGLRVSREAEIEGLDFTAHGEKAYNP
ncbi:MAG TPA: ammonium transporter [Kiloniellaceae bacterium]